MCIEEKSKGWHTISDGTTSERVFMRIETSSYSLLDDALEIWKKKMQEQAVQEQQKKDEKDTIADIVSEASSVACWMYVQKYVKQKTLDEMLQELPGASQFIIVMDTWFERLMAE